MMQFGLGAVATALACAGVSILSLAACVAQKDRSDQREPISSAKPAAGTGSGSGTGSGTAAAGPSGACLHIVDGTPATGNSPTSYPSVYLVAYPTSGGQGNVCTGVFVSDNVLLTASHCLPPTAGAPLLLFGNTVTVDTVNGTPTKSEALYPANLSLIGDAANSPNNNPSLIDQQTNDIALVVFPDGTATSWSPLALTTRPSATSVTLVGYGQHVVSTSNFINDHVKYFGTNSLYDMATATPPWNVFNDPFLYFLRGNPGQTASAAMSAFGDSGGPIFDGSTLIGTVVAGFTNANFSALTPQPTVPFSAGIGAAALSVYFNVTATTLANLINQLQPTTHAHPHVNYEVATGLATTSGSSSVAGPGASAPAAAPNAAAATSVSGAVIPTTPVTATASATTGCR